MKDTRKEITLCAIDLFKKQGYEKTTVMDICKEAKITKGTFYYHFNSKDEIAFEYYDMIFKDFSDTLVDVMMLSNAKEQLWKVFEYTIDRTIALTPQVLYALLMADIQQGFDLFGPYKNRDGRSGSDKMYSLQLKLVQKGQEAGQIRKGDPNFLLRTYISALIGIAISWARSNGAFDEKEELKKTFDLIF
jgi:AcrR family transcriptional regulator